MPPQLKQANSVTVTLLGDDSDPQLFRNGIQQRERLRRLAKDAGCSCEVENLVRNSDTAFSHLERHFFTAGKYVDGRHAAHHLVSGQHRLF